MSRRMTRRRLVAAGPAALVGMVSPSVRADDSPKPQGVAAAAAAPSPRYCLNTATIMGHRLPIDREAEIAAKAGYVAIEPWVRKIDEYRERGGSLPDLRKKIADLGLTVESAVGFAEWAVDDASKRAAGLERMKRDMELVERIGGRRIAAPPAGVTNAVVELRAVAERYIEILKIGRQVGVVPQVELWGASKTLSRLGEAAYVLAEAGSPDACAVLDVIHIARSGSDFDGLRAFHASMLHVFHVNDYPGGVAPRTIPDSQRVYPGDGAAPWAKLRAALRAVGFRGAFSLELFNPTYYAQDPQAVADAGLAKMKAVLEPRDA